MKATSFIVGIGLLLCISFLTGCATGATSAGMAGQEIPHVTASQGSVNVLVTGGHETNPLWASDISSPDFQTALIESLRKSAIFQSVDAERGATYKLSVRLDSIEQPLVGFNMTVNLRTDWTLVRFSDDLVLWQHPIFSTYTATVGDAFAAIKRLRLANEGAARKNIEQGLAQLATVKLTP